MFRSGAESRTGASAGASSGTTQGTSGVAKGSPDPVDDSPVHCRVLFVYNSHNEWPLERRLVWNEVLPELQNYAFHCGIDLEMADTLTDQQKVTAQVHRNTLRAMEDPNTVVVLLIGDKYGDGGLPLELRKEEFDAIREAVFEHNQDVKYLEKYYILDRTRNPEEYRLKADLDDPKVVKKLLALMQKGAETAFQEGSINQIAPHRQQRFFWSFLHSILYESNQIDKHRVCYILRKFEGAVQDKNNEPWVDIDEESLKKVLAFTLQADGGEVKNFFSGRDADKYRDNFSRQLLERLKQCVMKFAPTRLPSSSLLSIAIYENFTHIRHLRDRLKRQWQPRKSIDAKIEELTKDMLPGAYMIQGPEMCGKTQTLLRIFELTEDKTAYRIVLFTGLTYSSTFAHELWRTVCILLCNLSGKDPKPLFSVFKFSDLITQLHSLLEKLDRPLFLFIDDVHQIKFGRLLSVMDRRPKSAPSNLVLFMTASNVGTVTPVFLTSQTVNLDPPTEGEITDIVKKRLTTNSRKLSTDQLGTIKQYLTGGEKNVTVGLMLVEEILLRGNGVMKGGIEGRLERIEGELGAAPVTCVCRYLSVSSHGLTRLELQDVLSANRSLLQTIGSPVSFPPFLLDSILEALGSLLSTIYINGRIIYHFSHSSIWNVVRHRYLTASTELKAAHGDLADIFADLLTEIDGISPRAALQYQVFPQLLKRDNGSINMRKVRNLWYHLLHTGNMDALKELALCQFDYLDATVRSCGISHLLTMYEECVLQVLHHDIQVLCEQVLLPALETVVKDNEQLAAEVIGRLRYTRAENSHFLNTMVEQAMAWVDTYSKQPLLVPLTCWIPPPQMKQVLSFRLKDWKSAVTLATPTENHQHLLTTGNLSQPGLIYMYHIASQILITTFKGHTATVTSLTTSRDGIFFVSTSHDKTVRQWSFANGECSRVMKHHTAKVMCSILSSDDKLLITGSADSSAKVILVESGEVVRSFGEHTGSVVSLQLTSNDQLLITGSGDFVVQVWDMHSGRLVNRMGGLMAPVTCIAITSNDAFVAVACEDETLRIFGTVNCQELHELSGHESKVNALACANDDCQLYAATKSKIYCYDLHTGQIVEIMDCEEKSPVTSLKITSDNYFLISGCGCAISVWNVRERIHDSVDALQADEEGFVTAIAMSNDEKIAACGTHNGIVALWDLDICQCITTVVQNKNVSISAIAFTIDSSCLLSANKDGHILVLDSAHGNVLRNCNYHQTEVISICCLENGRAVTCDKSGLLKMWDVFADEGESEELSANGVLPPIYVPPSGRIMIGHVPNTKKEMKIWTFGDNALAIKNKVQHNEEITCFCATSMGSLVVTGSTDQSLKIWQIDSGFLTQVLVGHEDVVTCCALSDDEHVVVSGARDHKVVLWSVQTGDPMRTVLTGSAVTAVAITADGSVAFSADEAGWIEAWFVDKGTLLSSFNAHRPIKSLSRSFDANRVIAHLLKCAQLPILCLHNTPAGPHLAKERRRSARAHSISSVGSNLSESKKDSMANIVVPSTSNGSTTPKPIPPRPTFDKLERSKSRTSLVEKDRSTALPAQVAAPAQKSKICMYNEERTDEEPYLFVDISLFFIHSLLRPSSISSGITMNLWTNQTLAWYDFFTPFVAFLWYLFITWFLSITIIQNFFIGDTPPKQPPFGTCCGCCNFGARIRHLVSKNQQSLKGEQ
ncbi:unnamed protein product, partial [Mesorhabditis belari]|uniref:NWD1/2-like winged helix-turn-helix domain-containing protein n=1 Tax=Mesorhabditis belari TaxID=2138241 RepID=A0AAF3JBF3_9BILA